MDWEALLSNIGSGATGGAGIGMGMGPWGGLIGGGIGGIAGLLSGLAENSQQKQTQQKVEGLLKPEAYVPFGQTPEGQQFLNSANAGINQNYNIGRTNALTTAARDVQGTGMLHSSVLPYAQGQMTTPVEQAKASELSGLNQTMGQMGYQAQNAWQNREMQKRLTAAGYWQSAGQQGAAQGGQMMSGVQNLGQVLMLLKMLQGGQGTQGLNLGNAFNQGIGANTPIIPIDNAMGGGYG